MDFMALARVSDSATIPERMEKMVFPDGVPVPAVIYFDIVEANRALKSDPNKVYVGQFANYYAVADKDNVPDGVRYSRHIGVMGDIMDSLDDMPEIAEARTAWLHDNEAALRGKFYDVWMPTGYDYIAIRDGVPVPSDDPDGGLEEVGDEDEFLVEVIGGARLGMVAEVLPGLRDMQQYGEWVASQFPDREYSFDDAGNLVDTDPAYIADGSFHSVDSVDSPVGSGVTHMSDIGSNVPGHFPARKRHCRVQWDSKYPDRVLDSEDRGFCVFPAESELVGDGKDHFPINTKTQARAALAYVNQYDAVPDWYVGKGGVQAMVDRVVHMVHDRYPDIEISKEAKEAK